MTIQKAKRKRMPGSSPGMTIYFFVTTGLDPVVFYLFA
jgi:hypothetical protein